MAYNEIFDEDPNDEEALLSSLGGVPPADQGPALPAGPTPEEVAWIKKMLAASAPKPGTMGARPGPAAPSSPARAPYSAPATEPAPPPRAPAAQMRAANPEERLLDRLDESDPMAASQARFDLRTKPQLLGEQKPPPGPTAMRAATGAERFNDARGAVYDALMPAWMNAKQTRNETVPEPAYQSIDPMMGTAAPGEGGVDEVLKQVLKKAKKPPKAAPWAWAPTDEAAQARMKMFGDEESRIRYSALPKEARPAALHKTLSTPPATADDFVGVTIQPSTGQMVVGGKPGPTMAGKFPNSSSRTIAIPVAQFTPKHIQDFYNANRDVFAKDPKAFLGGWLDKSTNEIYLDVSKGFTDAKGKGDIRKATKFAELQNPGTVMGKMKGKPTGIERDPQTGLWPQAQKKLFDPESYSEPNVGNAYEFLSGLIKDSKGLSFRDRIRQMAQVGKDAMHGEDPEWWDIRKTAKNPDAPIPRVYGDDMVEPVAGYTATMSPQNGPVDDMQMASEYVRRHIKGEPIVQPDWVAPANAMGSQSDKGGFSPGPGMKFPNEDFYAINAQKVREGRYDELTQDKVNDMYHALVGDDVAVLDRHWAKIGDDPESGIFTASEKNVIEPSMTSGKIENYPTMYNAERDEALAAGVPIKKHSAWVWEGIRKTIRDTGELFGQKHPAGAVPDTTTGFNEIFTDLVQKKAKHLGITVAEMESRLRSGDAELLGAILSTSVGAAAYAKWRAVDQSKPPGGGA